MKSYKLVVFWPKMFQIIELKVEISKFESLFYTFIH